MVIRSQLDETSVPSIIRYGNTDFSKRLNGDVHGSEVQDIQ